MTTFPSATVTFNDRIVATLPSYVSKQRADIIFDKNLILGGLYNSDRTGRVSTGGKPLLKIGGNRVRRKAGRELRMPVLTEHSTNVQTFGGTEELDTNIDALGTTQRAEWGLYTTFEAQPWVEAMENSGEDAVLDNWQDRLYRAYADLARQVETDLWSANADTVRGSQNGIVGIQTLIANTPTNTVWNLSRGSFTAHANQSTNAASTAFATSGLGHMRHMARLVQGTNGTDPWSLVMTTPALWEAYTAEAEDIHQITMGRTAELGFDVAIYQGKPIVYSGSCLAGAMYFVNLDYARLFMHARGDFSSQMHGPNPKQAIENSIRIFFATQWGFERMDRQGVIYGFTDA